ncbi:MAG TPA: hypothetical protein VEJ68_02570 [Candidatus Bathyarchaeia archaeon]|nr:hypothetical protein [Candidatus Bathyarchaeia archaeon]
MKSWIAFLLVISVVSTTIPLAHAQVPVGVSTKFQNGVWVVPVNKQVQITADVSNGQERDQPFAYLVQVKDQNDIVVQLSWLTGTLTPGQSLNPSQSWTPTNQGSYTAEIFVWNSISNPDALSPPLVMNISVT